ncbi:MAG TPA: class I SAM-dependent methyltransferase [Vicinamibacterales bacterium]|nr:class I SAM-dependent methyltransferase [Vicinamibacterales bacterium]
MQDWARKVTDGREKLPCTVAVITRDGERLVLGDGPLVLTVHVRTERGERALRAMSLLGICEAYIHDDLDFEGDLLEAASIQTKLTDREIFIKLWRRLKPYLMGRSKSNADAIREAYDRNNIQLVAADENYHTYTPGIYESDRDSLEVGARRKLQAAFDSLNLQPGDHLLDVGCGWGGFMRFCAERGVRATGITLSKHQLAFVQRFIDQGLNAEVFYQDFFTYEPSRQFDAVSLMGVLEDLSDYRTVIERLTTWVRPGGRIYFDFAASKERHATSSFITKYIWPGVFRMVYLPELIEAVWRSPFELVLLDNDRLNYFRWARESDRRWIERKAKVLQQADEETWRTFRLMHAGCANIMRDATRGAAAYRMVLEMPQPAAQARARVREAVVAGV